MLSNTATPKYYEEFRDRVVSGEIPVCETISLEMNRIDSLIANPGVYYDESKVEGWILFCESELTLTDGSELHLLDTFKLWAEQVYGWYYFIEREVYNPLTKLYEKKVVKQRLIRKQILIIARGNAKTQYNSAHHAYGLVIDKSTTHQIAVAPTMKLAEHTLSPLRTAITKSRGPLFQFLTMGDLNSRKTNKNRPKLIPTKRGIENLLTNSLLEVLPMSIPKLQGLQNKISSIDEWLSCDIREDVIGAVEQGASKLKDYLILATSSEGTVRNGPGDDIKMEALSILKNEYYNPHVSIFWYRLDSLEEVDQPEMWVKACPNIGYTVSYETYHLDVERMEKAQAARNDILAKRFGIPMEGYTYYFSYEETIPHRKVDFSGLSCSMGCDLSLGDDFCAFTFLFPLAREKFGVKCRSYITERTLNALPASIRYKYDLFIEEGSLEVFPGTILDLEEVYDDLSRFIEEKDYDVCCVGYDPYGAKEFINRWIMENGPYGVEKVPQGAKTESIPLGKIKKLSEDGLLIFDEEIMSFSMGNAIALEDTNGNRKLYKMRREDKIDNVAAGLDAFVAYEHNKNNF